MTLSYTVPSPVFGLRQAKAREPRQITVDSTGLKVPGAGEFYVRKLGMGRYVGRESDLIDRPDDVAWDAVV